MTPTSRERAEAVVKKAEDEYIHEWDNSSTLMETIIRHIAAALEAERTELGDLRLRLNCPMLQPSCLLCGQQRELVVRHLEAQAIGVCELCRKRASEPRLRWSPDKPTVAGLYFWRYGKGYNSTIREVFNAGVAGVLLFRDFESSGQSVASAVGEWAGPMPMPEEGE